MKKEIIVMLISLVLEIAGSIMLIPVVGWRAFIGMFLFISGSNISMGLNLRKEIKERHI